KDPPRQSLIRLRRGVDQRFVPASSCSKPCLEGAEESERGAEEPEPLVEPVRVEPMLRTGDLDARAVMFAGEVGRPGDKLFAATPPAMMRRDDKAGDSANRRATGKIRHEFGAQQADDLACRLCKQKTAAVVAQRTAKAVADIRLLRRVAELA